MRAIYEGRGSFRSLDGVERSTDKETELVWVEEAGDPPRDDRFLETWVD